MGKILPIEVCEHVIDCVHTWGDVGTLKTCSLVCRHWYSRCRFHLVTKICLKNQREVARLAKDVRKKHNLGCHVKQIVIGADWRGAISVEVDGRLRTPISHLGLFAIMFAGIFTNVESISLQDVAWKSGDLHPDVFLHLSAFTSITQLHLKTVKFQSVTIFSRLITSLPNLETLVCWSNPSVGVFDPSSLSKFKSGWPRASKLSHLHLQLSPFQSRISNFEHPSAGEFLSQFLIATGWSGNLQKIRVDISSGASSDAESTYIQALLRSASGSLRNLTLLFDLDKGPEEDTISQLNHLCFERNFMQVY